MATIVDGFILNCIQLNYLPQFLFNQMCETERYDLEALNGYFYNDSIAINIEIML